MLRFLQMIKQAVITLVTSDTSDYPQGQAEYNGKTTDYTRLSPYGLDSNPPDGAWVLLLSSQGQEAVKFGIASDFLGRLKGLKKGEVALYNTVTKSFILLKENGDIEINAKADLLTNVVNNLTAVIGGNTEITTPTFTINANVVVNGDLAVSGTMTNDAVNVGKTHIHSQGVDGGGDAEVDTGGPHS
jgi:phage gp45-like